MIERVVWVDSGLSYASTWLDEATVVERAKSWTGEVVTVGQVIYEDENVLVLGLSKDSESDAVACCFLIWKGAITSRQEFE